MVCLFIRLRRFILWLLNKRDKLRIGILISGRGSNMEAIIKSCREGRINGKVVIVISDNPSARGLEVARSYGIKSLYIYPGKYKTKFETDREWEYVRVLRKYCVDIVVMAGFMRIVKEPLLSSFKNRVINIHPSLLPKYPGLETHTRVLEAGEKIHGCTVHFANDIVDGGKIIMQAKVKVFPDDTPDTLAKRVLEKEHQILVKTLSLIANGEISFDTLKEPIVYDVNDKIL
ncbi:MAG: phosphoribosylglycinamide formyltransferase [Brevinematales bacterium]|nr:phosphoribosylglycinamide formyltransferase [Brevinematales bacterium]